MEDDLFRGFYTRKAVTRFLITRTRLSAFSCSTRPPRFAGEWNHAIAVDACKMFFEVFEEIAQTCSIIVEPLAREAIIYHAAVIDLIRFRVERVGVEDRVILKS